MLLERIEIGAHGPLKQVQLGPFSQALNVVHGPDGSGKTAIARFIRDSMINAIYPQGMFSASSGRVVWADSIGLVHCCRECDGTPHGHRTVSVEPRSETGPNFDGLKQSWLNDLVTHRPESAHQSSSPRQSLELQTLGLPESIADGLIVDTSVTSVRHVVESAVRSGLDDRKTFESLPFDVPESTVSSWNEHQRRELAEIDREISRLSALESDYQRLIERRSELTSRLASEPTSNQSHHVDYQRRHAGWQRRLMHLHDRARQLRQRQGDLRRWITQFDTENPVDVPVGDPTNHRQGHSSPTPYGSNVWTTSFTTNAQQSRRWQRERRVSELNRVTAELDSCLREAADVRRSLRSFRPVFGTHWHLGSRNPQWVDREACVAELRRIDEQLASMSRLRWLRTRRNEILQRHGGQSREFIASNSPLADRASHWVVRLSAGRLRRIQWNVDAGVATPHAKSNAHSSQKDSIGRNSRLHARVTIDGRNERDCCATDRALAALAVRMAAADLLARAGRPIPLVLETHRELVDAVSHQTPHDDAPWYYQHGDWRRANHPIATALHDYCQSGRQVIVLTSSETLTSHLSRVGARVFNVHAEPVIHPYRPLWKPSYAAEHYVGPHAHSYGHRDAEDVIGTVHVQPPVQRRNVTPDQINRDFDVASHQPTDPKSNTRTQWDHHPIPTFNNSTDHPHAFVSDPVGHAPTTSAVPPVRQRSPRDTGPVPPNVFRDGYFYANTFTSDPSRENNVVAQADAIVLPQQANRLVPSTIDSSSPNSIIAKPRSPYYLTVDSPIDQAPSIDAVAAARLRGLNVTHVTHLMQADANRLSDALGLGNVDASTIRRWQSECRLMCRVPNLRGFDARILVGCGITTPAQLAAIHPADLLERVESFLTTKSGQRILASGSGREISRLTSWMAAANLGIEPEVGAEDFDLSTTADHRSSSRSDRASNGRNSGGTRTASTSRTSTGRTSTGRSSGGRRHSDRQNDGLRRGGDDHNAEGQADIVDFDAAERSGRRRRQRSTRSRRDGYSATASTSRRRSRSNSSGNESRRRRRSADRHDDHSQTRRQTRSRRSLREHTSSAESHKNHFGSHASHTRSTSSTGRSRDHESTRQYDVASTQQSDQETELKFYLDLESPVVDAPSIGPRMAERLSEVGIETVADLLAADPDEVAEQLEHRRTDGDTVRNWQDQARLVCCVPALRGHDAQLLVAADVTTPEALAASDPEELLQAVDAIARSRQGKRILRGGKFPDLEEVEFWIANAQHHRQLRAA